MVDFARKGTLMRWPFHPLASRVPLLEYNRGLRGTENVDNEEGCTDGGRSSAMISHPA